MKITKISSNECGGFKPPKGHLDTQMFPECEGTPCDRNIVKKTVEKRKKNKKKAEDTGIFSKISMANTDVLISSISFYRPESILEAIKITDEEDMFSKIEIEDIDAVLSLCEDFQLEKILNYLTNGNQLPKTEAELDTAGNINQIVTSKKKKKKWNPNPWAVCNTTVDKDKNPEKFERCVQDVKKKQAFNLKDFLKVSMSKKAELDFEEVKEAWENSSEDIIVNDKGEAFYAGKLITRPTEDYGADFVAIKKWMDSNGYFPNVWVINDHGNTSLFSIDERGKEKYLGGIV